MIQQNNPVSRNLCSWDITVSGSAYYKSSEKWISGMNQDTLDEELDHNFKTSFLTGKSFGVQDKLGCIPVHFFFSSSVTLRQQNNEEAIPQFCY